MGNKLCCDAKNQDNPLLSTKTAQQIIEDFMKNNIRIKQVCPTPLHTYGTIVKKVKQYQNGVYIGSIANKKRNGLGLMMFNQGLWYEGEWVDDKFKGRGRFVFTNGDYYDGQWDNCLPQGQGEYFNRQNNWKYVGSWEKGIQNGKGRQTFQDGSYYQGSFLNGQRHGKGKFRNHDGRYYQGSFFNNQVQGAAIAVDFSYFYEGEWKNGKMDGAGKSQWYEDNGKVFECSYIGQYKQGIKQGNGQYKDKNGNIFKGNWKDGQATSNGLVMKK